MKKLTIIFIAVVVITTLFYIFVGKKVFTPSDQNTDSTSTPASTPFVPSSTPAQPASGAPATIVD